MRRSPRTLAAGLLVAAGFLSPPCLADDASSAAEWVKLGVQDFKRDDYDAARVAFGHAYSVEPKATTLISLALAELQSGHALEAVGHLRAYLKDPGAEPAKVDVVRSKWLPRAEEQTARLAIEAPAGAEIQVDGQSQGAAPLAAAIDVSVGEHDVQARLGTWSRSIHVSTTGGQLRGVHFETSAEVAEPPAAAPAAPATAPAPPAPLERTTEHGGFPVAKVVTVLAVGTAALTATVLGIVYANDSQSDASTAAGLRAGMSSSSCAGSNASSSHCTALSNATQSESRDYWTSTGLYIGGGVLAGAALATWFLWPAPRAQSAWTVRPMLDPRVAGAFLNGSF